MRNRRNLSIYVITLFALLLLTPGRSSASDGKTDNSADWFYPKWAAKAPYAKPIIAKDTDSALGRYSLKTKEIGLKDIARIHGHMCDGMVIAFVEIKPVLEKLFQGGVVDRTDLRAVSKNGPCWVDTVAMMTGARINFQTLRIDNTTGDGFIIQKISTGQTYDVRLKPDVFPKEQAELEANIRKARSKGDTVSKSDIDAVEKMADALSLKILSSPPADLLVIRELPGYKFTAADMFGNRGDIINKEMPR